jgi:adenylate cyclase
LSETTHDQTRSDLEKLRRLIDELSQVIDQYQVQFGLATSSAAEQRNNLLRLVTQASLALDSVSRGIQLQEKEHKQLQALQEVGALINSSHDLGEVLNTVMDAIIRLTGAERGFLMLHDEDAAELNVEVARNINQETLEKSSFEISRSIVRSVADTGEPIVTTNAQADPRFAGQESIISYNLRSILCVPLKIKRNIIGVIYADNRVVSGIFLDSDRDMLAAFANQAAVAIENARLFRKIRDQLANIREMKSLQDNVFESIASGVITIDEESRVALYNRAAERILGVGNQEVIDRDYRLLFPPPMDKIVESLVEKIMGSGNNHNMEVDANLQDKAGTTTLNLSFSPLRDVEQETQGVALVLEDISERKRLESVRRYLPPALVERARDIDAAQRPQRRQLSVLFADIRGFSTASEAWEPELLIEVVNGYLTVAAQAINKYEGLIDKYDGDAVMALFNTPLNPQEDHVERAVRTALAVRQGVNEYHAALPEEHRLYFGIGIHSAEALVGNVGSPLRKDYSAIGDAVNLAFRLQDLAGPDQILLSENTCLQVATWAETISLPPVRVKGRQAEEKIFELVGLR